MAVLSTGDIAISAEGLAKSYLIGHQMTRQRESFREMMTRTVRGVGRTAFAVARGQQIVYGDTVEEFWALKDVSFEVKRGEVIGVIGRNGAGKSTLLKILSRITEPTRGRAVIRGRVASLLEVGTGFHAELTGRENIYLNGAILGMTRAEIKRKFDEIVAFAEVEKFLDTPVKRYSSGMYVRLAFAVAAHLEPEILIIDEVLAVGDVAFQKRCLGKMQDVARSGRTVVFVSHNLPAVIDLTARSLLLEHGEIRSSGPSRQVVSEFLRTMQVTAGASVDLAAFRRAERMDGYVDIEEIRICGTPLGSAKIAFGEPLAVEVDVAVHRPIEAGVMNIVILNDQLDPIVTFASADADFSYTLRNGRHTIRCHADAPPLIPGDYRLTIGIGQMGRLSWDVLETIPAFTIDGTGNKAWINWMSRPGVLLFDKCEWHTDASERYRAMEVIAK